MTSDSSLPEANTESKPPVPPGGSAGSTWYERLRLAVRVLAGLALASLLLEYGFDQPPLPVFALVAVEILAVAAYLASSAHQIATAASNPEALKKKWFDAALLIGAATFLVFRPGIAEAPAPAVSALLVAVMQVAIALRLLAEAVRLNLALARSKLHPARRLALTFGVLIVAGTLTLSLPRSTGQHLRESEGFSAARHVLNCAFTSVSATCVTGLVVYDTGEDFTTLGQIVILVLIQLGGLGIMVFGSVFGLLVSHRLSLRQTLALQDSLSLQALGRMRRMILFIILLTFAAEGVGAALLYPMWTDVMPASERLFQSVFHAVSAFCNAGFALRSDSLMQFGRSWQVYGCIMPMIVLGGLGFPVLHDLWHGLRAVIRRQVARMRRQVEGDSAPPRSRFTLHTKIVLTATVILIFLPTAGFVVFESGRPLNEAVPTESARDGALALATMRGAGFSDRVLDALFLSVSCRTAGFNTVAMDPDSMSPASHLLACLLMFIGGSPASTAGGVKTMGMAILLLGVWTTMRGRANVEAFGRTLPETIVRRAAVIVIVMFAVVSLVTLVLAQSEGVSLREALFESVSACGTVGLSTGMTPDLTTTGRLVIMVAMFAGRLGPLTLLIALAGERRLQQYEYPEEEVGIG